LEKINVLVVDDSALMRKIISDMINTAGDMEIMGTCRNGEDLLLRLKDIKPDVITLDVEMPKMDGITALKQMKAMHINIPVIVLSSLSKQGAHLTMECLEAGAFDFLPKPSGSISLDLNKVQDELVEKVRLASNRKRTVVKKEVPSSKTLSENPRVSIESRGINAVVMGASTGGPKALYSVITDLPEDLNVPVFVVQHMPQGFTRAFAERLNKSSKLKVLEASEGENIENNTVYIAPGGRHMILGQDRRIHLSDEPPIWGVRPAVDKLFSSASKLYGSHLLSAVLTGMGKDGASGTMEIKNAGGITISEDESSCTIYGMPRAAYETGKVDMVLPLKSIASEITNVVKSSRR
jgi:two-component system, chemotaxis family, protein-glutamate methylesterase/glutaminase